MSVCCEYNEKVTKSTFVVLKFFLFNFHQLGFQADIYYFHAVLLLFPRDVTQLFLRRDKFGFVRIKLKVPIYFCQINIKLMFKAIKLMTVLIGSYKIKLFLENFCKVELNQSQEKEENPHHDGDRKV